MKKQRLKKAALIFAAGAIGYNLLELVYRGRTHISMSIAGGTSLLLLCKINACSKKLSRVKRCALGALAITCIEYITGLIVNVWMKLNVWDYSGNRFNLHGQICPLFCGIWFLLCIPVSFVYDFITSKQTGKTKHSLSRNCAIK